MSDAIYHDAIVALARDASAAGALDAPQATATVDNPLCGDRVAVDLAFEGERISALRHRVRGCLLCQASAAALAIAAVGATREDLRAGAASLAALLKDGAPLPAGRFAPFAAFAPLARHRSRHDCAKLPLLAAEKALGTT